MKHVFRLTVLLLLVLGPVAAVFANVSRNVEAAVSRNVQTAVSRNIVARVGALHRNVRATGAPCGGHGCRACRVAGVLARAGRIALMQTTRAFALVLDHGLDNSRTAVETAPPGGR